jgi:HSP20 family protein
MEYEFNHYHRIERTYGTFSRTFSLPRTVDQDSIPASYRDGILEVTIPKREEAKPKQIQINATAGAVPVNQ